MNRRWGVVWDKTTIMVVLGLAAALVVLVVAGGEIRAGLGLILLVALPFLALGTVIYLGVKYGTRAGRRD